MGVSCPMVWQNWVMLAMFTKILPITIVIGMNFQLFKNLVNNIRNFSKKFTIIKIHPMVGTTFKPI